MWDTNRGIMKKIMINSSVQDIIGESTIALSKTENMLMAFQRYISQDLQVRGCIFLCNKILFWKYWPDRPYCSQGIDISQNLSNTHSWRPQDFATYARVLISHWQAATESIMFLCVTSLITTYSITSGHLHNFGWRIYIISEIIDIYKKKEWTQSRSLRTYTFNYMGSFIILEVYHSNVMVV